MENEKNSVVKKTVKNGISFGTALFLAPVSFHIIGAMLCIF